MAASGENSTEPFQEVQHAFMRHMRDPESNPAPQGIEDRRMDIYRGLIYRNIQNFIANSFPVLRTIIADPHWHDMVRDYICCHQARTPLFPRMPIEFLHYLEHERQTQPHDPPFMLELARYEWGEVAVSLDPREVDLCGVDVEGDVLERIPVLNPIVLPQTYHYPVHRISVEYQPDHPPETPTHILLYRRPDDVVKFLELSAASAHLFECLRGNTQKTGRQIVEMIAGELVHPDPEVVVQGGVDMLREMHARDLILGVAA